MKLRQWFITSVLMLVGSQLMFVGCQSAGNTTPETSDSSFEESSDAMVSSDAIPDGSDILSSDAVVESSEEGDESSDANDVSSEAVVESSDERDESSDVSDVSSEAVIESSEENGESSDGADSSEDTVSECVPPEVDGGAYDTYDGFTLVIADEFDSFDDCMWTKTYGSWTDNDVLFMPENVSVEDGKLLLNMTRDNPKGGIAWDQRTVRDPRGKIVGSKDFSSGEVRSHREYKYGRFVSSFRSEAPNHISTMFLYNIPSDSIWLEIDIEVMTNHPGKPTSNLLIDWDGAQNYNDLIKDGNDDLIQAANGVEDAAHNEFHEYMIEWTPDRVAWFIDGVQFREITDKTLIPDEGIHIMFNFWLLTALSGATQDGYLENGEYASTEYEYFRYYKWDGEDDYEEPAWCGDRTWNDAQGKCE
ncbi:MAG: family 16 glycosylhydrolase [Fibrobacterales bacterium]